MHNKTLGVQDINHAAYLLTCGYQIERITRDGPVVCWHFEDCESNAEKRIHDFISGNAFGDCKHFSDSLKTLKQTLRK